MRVLSTIAAAIFLLLVNGCSVKGSSQSRLNRHTILPNEGTVSTLNARANNPSIGQAERARAIFTLFAHRIHPGASAAGVHQALTDPTWLDKAEIHKLAVLFGWIPIRWERGNTAVFVRIFPDNTTKPGFFGDVLWHGGPDWIIYLEFSGELQENDVLRFLRGEELAGTPKLVEFALVYPNSSKPGVLRGRSESFTRDGIEVNEEDK